MQLWLKVSLQIREGASTRTRSRGLNVQGTLGIVRDTVLSIQRWLKVSLQIREGASTRTRFSGLIVRGTLGIVGITALSV